MSETQNIKNNISEVRKQKGLSRKEAAERSGIPLRTIEDWEAGRHGWKTFAQLCQYADVIGCSLDELFGRKIPEK